MKFEIRGLIAVSVTLRRSSSHLGENGHETSCNLNYWRMANNPSHLDFLL